MIVICFLSIVNAGYQENLKILKVQVHLYVIFKVMVWPHMMVVVPSAKNQLADDFTWFFLIRYEGITRI